MTLGADTVSLVTQNQQRASSLEQPMSTTTSHGQQPMSKVQQLQQSKFLRNQDA